MTSYAPMAVTEPSAMVTPAGSYAAPAGSYAIPPYAAPVYAPQQQSFGAPIPLTPVIIPSSPGMEAEGLLASEEESGFFMKKILGPILALPLLLLIPIVVVVVVVVVRIAIIVVPVIFPGSKKMFGFPESLTTTTEKPYYPYEEKPYDYQSNTTYDAPYPSQRQRRQADKKTSSALPSMSIAQVEKLTQVVFAALRSEECIQRLLCEAGQMSKTFSDTAYSVAKSVEPFVPESIKPSYEIFSQAEKCEQYTCGSLNVKK